MKGTDTGQRDYRPVRPYWCRHIAAQSAHPLLKERSEAEKIALLSSMQHISPETCPTLMLHGEQDSVVYPFHSMKFYELFGISLQFSDQKVTTLLSNRIGPSVQLGLQAVAFGTVVGIVLGVIAAMKQNTWIDTFCSLFAITGRSVPNFIIAVLGQFIFAITLKWMPIGLWDDGFRSTILPTLALSISPMADAARFIRTEMVDVLSSEYIELARAKGMGPWRVAFTHGLRNALIPLITILGSMTVSLMTGSLFVENIFAVPGIGEQFTKSILSNDYYTIMAVAILFSALLVVVIFITDILYQLIDPRVRVEGSHE